MHEYEMMFILTPELDEAGLEASAQRVRAALEARGAEIASLEPWGRRRMAYQVDRFRDGYYTLARFKMDPARANDLERALKLNDQVLRHLLIRLDSN